MVHCRSIRSLLKGFSPASFHRRQSALCFNLISIELTPHQWPARNRESIQFLADMQDRFRSTSQGKGIIEAIGLLWVTNHAECTSRKPLWLLRGDGP